MTSVNKSCPFCGVSGLPHPLDHKEGCYLRYFYEILAEGSPTGGDVMREAWNTRAERTCGEWRGETYMTDSGFTETDSRLWCEHCDIPLEEDWRYCPECGAKRVD
jgi:RNA polymerase subunit RPABC4/transcription elongation factor Spt4